MHALRLEPLAPHHLDALTAMLPDPDVLRFTRVPNPPPPDFTQQWYDRYEACRRDGTREAFAAIDAAGAFVGVALAPDIDRAEAEVELGYMVAPEARRRGVATAMLLLLTEWAFAEAGALRATLVIHVENPGSRRVAQRCGYHFEGVMRSVGFTNGRRIDAELWSRLPSDPPPARV
jgi:RimJ/RimL family protein N-acetyltransferase